jgi:hypothetical protein
MLPVYLAQKLAFSPIFRGERKELIDAALSTVKIFAQ